MLSSRALSSRFWSWVMLSLSMQSFLSYGLWPSALCWKLIRTKKDGGRPRFTNQYYIYKRSRPKIAMIQLSLPSFQAHWKHTLQGGKYLQTYHLQTSLRALVTSSSSPTHQILARANNFGRQDQTITKPPTLIWNHAFHGLWLDSKPFGRESKTFEARAGQSTPMNPVG
jgi:hypothetical protein